MHPSPPTRLFSTRLANPGIAAYSIFNIHKHILTSHDLQPFGSGTAFPPAHGYRTQQVNDRSSTSSSAIPTSVTPLAPFCPQPRQQFSSGSRSLVPARFSQRPSKPTSLTSVQHTSTMTYPLKLANHPCFSAWSGVLKDTWANRNGDQNSLLHLPSCASSLPSAPHHPPLVTSITQRPSSSQSQISCAVESSRLATPTPLTPLPTSLATPCGLSQHSPHPTTLCYLSHPPSLTPFGKESPSMSPQHLVLPLALSQASNDSTTLTHDRQNRHYSWDKTVDPSCVMTSSCDFARTLHN
jgi:hypothetical protein